MGRRCVPDTMPNAFTPRPLSGLAAREIPNIPRRVKALKRISESRCRLSDADIIRRSSGPRAERATPISHTFRGDARARPSGPGTS